MENVPTTTLTDEHFTDGGIVITDLLIACNLCASKGEAKRLIQQGGVAVNDEKITDPFAVVGADAFAEGFAMIKKGKKTYHKAVKE